MRTKLLAAITFFCTFWLVLNLYNSCYFESTEHIKGLKTLHTNLNSSRACVRSKAALDIQALGPAALDATERLVTLINDSDPSVRWRSVGALGHIQHFPAYVREALFTKIYDEHELTRANTIFAISQMQFENAEPFSSQSYQKTDEEFKVFLLGLNDSSPLVRYKTLIHLNISQIKEHGLKYKDEFQHSLIKLTRDPDPKVEGMALAQLYQLMGKDAVQKEITEYKDRVSKFLNSEDDLVRRAAAITTSSLEGKEYPVLLGASVELVDKAKSECDSGIRVFLGCYHYAKLLKYQGKDAEATRYYEKDCGLAGQHPSIGCTELGDEAIAAGELEKAKDLYKRTASIHGITDSAILKLGDIYTQEGNLEEACHWYLIACRNGMEEGCSKGQNCNAQEDVVRAVNLKANHNLKKAEQAYLDAVEEEKKGHKSSALDHYLEAHKNGSVIATLRSATLFRQAGQTEEAIKVLAESCDRLAPTTCIELASFYRSLGKVREAEESYKKACSEDRLRCSEYLAEFYLLNGNPSQAKYYLQFLCKDINDTRACDKIKNIEEKLIVPSNLISSCRNGDDKSCENLVTLYSKNYEYDKVIDTYKIICDREKITEKCDGLSKALWTQEKWNEYRLLQEDLCKNDKQACLQIAILEEHLLNLDKALIVLEKLCISDMMSRACGRMHTVAVKKYSGKELKTYLERLCDRHQEAQSCASLAALHEDEVMKSRYFNTAISLADNTCGEGDLEYCAAKGLFLCASGKIEEGKEEMKKACEKSSRFCRFVELCPKALEELTNSLKPRVSSVR